MKYLCLGAVLAALLPACLSAQNLPQSTPPPFSLLRCTPLPEPRQMHGSAVVGSRLYIMGGILNHGGWTPSVISAPIMEGGALGSWRLERSLPEIRNYISQSVEVVNDRVYIIGGGVAATTNTQEEDLQRARDVIWTSVKADGSLDEWKRSEEFLKVPTSCIATASTDRHLFVLGGSTQEGVSAETYVCDFDSKGAPVKWRSNTPLPVPLWFHGAAALEDRIYVWGGLTQKSKDAINPKVYSASISDDGTIGAWREETPMPAATYSSSFCGFNDYLVGVAGRYKGGVFTNAIWFARLQDGKVGPWTVLNTDLEARVYHALGLDKIHGYVYVSGGQYKDANTQGFGRMLATIQAFQISQPRQQRLEVAKTAPVSSSPSSQKEELSMLSVEAALAKAKQTSAKVVVLFYSPEVPACKRFWDDVVNTSAFRGAVSGYIVAVCDVAKEGPSVAARYGIFKVPAVAVLDSNGNLIQANLRLKTLEDLKSVLK